MQAIKVWHLNDRLSGRGGADQHLLGILTDQVRRGYDVTLCVAVDDSTAKAPCTVRIVEGLDRRESAPIGLERAPDETLIHVHNVMNPTAIVRADVMTVQDHRSFCPGRGKLTADDTRCTEPMAATTCAGCFEDDGYFRDIFATTQARVEALRAVPWVTVLSHYMAAELARVGVRNAAVIPPFVHDLPPVTAADDEHVLFVGRVVDAKGVFDAIAAWRKSGVDLPLVVAGTGRARNRVEALGITVTGWLDRPSLAALYDRAAAVILPSRWQEPFGIVGLEALSRGVPVVAWDSGGVSDWHPGPLVPWGDVDALALALRDALRAGPVPADTRFDRDRLMSALEGLYRAAITTRGAR